MVTGQRPAFFVDGDRVTVSRHPRKPQVVGETGEVTGRGMRLDGMYVYAVELDCGPVVCLADELEAADDGR